MRLLLVPAILLAFAAAPASAETLQQVVARGVVLTAGDARIDIAFTPDGRFVASSGGTPLGGGAWRIDGDKLCTRADATGYEDCAAYPLGKASGDSFVLSTPSGDVTIAIK